MRQHQVSTVLETTHCFFVIIWLFRFLVFISVILSDTACNNEDFNPEQSAVHPYNVTGIEGTSLYYFVGTVERRLSERRLTERPLIRTSMARVNAHPHLRPRGAGFARAARACTCYCTYSRVLCFVFNSFVHLLILPRESKLFL